MEQRYISVKEYSKMTKMAEATIRRNCRLKKLPNSEKIGGKWVIVLPPDEPSAQQSILKNEAVVEAISHIADGYNELLFAIKNI